MSQKTYQELREECRALRAAHKKIKAERDRVAAKNIGLLQLISATDKCKHPGCCCVCGHTGSCPEDGPCAVGNAV